MKDTLKVFKLDLDIPKLFLSDQDLKVIADKISDFMTLETLSLILPKNFNNVNISTHDFNYKCAHHLEDGVLYLAKTLR